MGLESSAKPSVGLVHKIMICNTTGSLDPHSTPLGL